MTCDPFDDRCIRCRTPLAAADLSVLCQDCEQGRPSLLQRWLAAWRTWWAGAAR